MANRIVARAPGTPVCAVETPSLDSVVLWLTLTIERDYIARGVFPLFRGATAATTRASSTLHYLTSEVAHALLDDAEARRQEVSECQKVAYTAHTKNLRAAIEEAKTRRAMFEASEPVCTYSSEWSERWRGTKEQLRAALGIVSDDPYPGEPGGKKIWAQVRDRRGYSVRITRASAIWAGLFQANIEFPEDVRDARREAERAAKADKDRLQRLKSMPATADKFREEVAASFWTLAMFAKAQMQPKDGYRFTSDVVDEFVESVTEAYWTVKNGETAGCSPRKKLQQVMGESAKADIPLQRFLANLGSSASD